MNWFDKIMKRLGYERTESARNNGEGVASLFSLAPERKKRGESFGDVTSIYFKAGQMEEFVKFHAWINAKMTLAGHGPISRNALIWAAVVIGSEKLKAEPLLTLDKMTAPFPK